MEGASSVSWSYVNKGFYTNALIKMTAYLKSSYRHNALSDPRKCTLWTDEASTPPGGIHNEILKKMLPSGQQHHGKMFPSGEPIRFLESCMRYNNIICVNHTCYVLCVSDFISSCYNHSFTDLLFEDLMYAMLTI